MCGHNVAVAEMTAQVTHYWPAAERPPGVRHLLWIVDSCWIHMLTLRPWWASRPVSLHFQSFQCLCVSEGLLLGVLQLPRSPDLWMTRGRVPLRAVTCAFWPCRRKNSFEGVRPRKKAWRGAFPNQICLADLDENGVLSITKSLSAHKNWMKASVT